MGCVSSTEVVENAHTGGKVQKKKLGGAHPGNRRVQHQPYVPPVSQFDDKGVAVSHFVAYGGGNALTLVQQDGSAQPQTSPEPSSQAQFVRVTLPAGVSSGQTIHVQAPDGRLNAIVIPPGFAAGDSFTVEFEADPLSGKTSAPPASTPNQASAVPPPSEGYTPPVSTAAYPVPSEPEITVTANNTDNGGSYPTTSATPVYTPQYTAATY